MEHPVDSKFAAGFSLIEVLIAVTILAVLAAGASLSAGRTGTNSETDQALFQRNFEVLSQLAITGAQTRGMRLTPKGMQLATRTAMGWDISERVVRWRGKVSATTKDPSAVDQPDLVFLANGESTPFSIVFADGKAVNRCQSDGFTGLTCQ